MKPEKFKQEYQTTQRLFDSFGLELSKQIQHILEENRVSLGFPIQSRTKTWDSLEKKLKSLTVKSILDVQDLCGLRFVLLFKRDISIVKEIISSHFKVIKEYDTHDKLDSDQFGYSSLHMIVEMNENWFSIPTLKGFKGLKAEIQIRTLAQHTWASASHILQYKTEENVPKSILRSIYRVSAILETVDIEFERFLDERDKYITTLNSLSLEEIAESQLNVNTLERILDANFPKQNKNNEESYSELIDELQIYKIKNPNEVINLIDKHKEHALALDKKYSLDYTKDQDYYFSHTGLLRSCMEHEDSEKYKELIKMWGDEV